MTIDELLYAIESSWARSSSSDVVAVVSNQIWHDILKEAKESMMFAYHGTQPKELRFGGYRIVNMPFPTARSVDGYLIMDADDYRELCRTLSVGYMYKG